jgi:succinate dehydrogenase/fumarate reductase flavoprotein subunit
VLASGGFEWNPDLVNAFLPFPGSVPTSPPGNEGDGLLIAIRHGAAIGNMTEAWWTAAIQVPSETRVGRELSRNVVRELALPGSVLVDRNGRRFVNEASSYNDLGKVLNQFDVGEWQFANQPAWLIFDHAFKARYPIAGLAAGGEVPDWIVTAPDVASLAQRLGQDPNVLTETIERFNRHARDGNDPEFGRGQDPHGLYYADAAHHPNGCLAPLEKYPLHAVRVVAGNNGTKGGLVTDEIGRVLRPDGSAVEGLFACGNAAASIMGPGYPGHGGSLGPIMTAAYRCGLTIDGGACQQA